MTTLEALSPKPKVPNHITGNVGLYFACYRLSQLGWNAIPTSRNARGIDVVAYNDLDICRLFQIKTVTGHHAVPLGTSVDDIRGDFWIILALAAEGPTSFIMLPLEVKERATRDKGGKQAYWLSRKDFFDDKFRERWDRVK